MGEIEEKEQNIGSEVSDFGKEISEFGKEKSEICQKCKGTGFIHNKDRNEVRVCIDCLLAGKLDVHSKAVKDSGIRI